MGATSPGPAMSGARHVHDLTATLETHMAVWPTAPLPVVTPVGIIARDGYAVERIDCLTHTGTHMDAPFHFLEGGATVDQIPPDRLVGPAMLLDLRKDLDGTLIRAAALERHWPKGAKPEFVLLETGWSHERDHTRRYLYEFPGLEVPAAEFLVRKGVRGVGIDTLGIDEYANSKFESHKVLLGHGIWVLEALDHLDELRENRSYMLVAAPLKIRGGSGAMSRVFAIET